MQPSQLRGCRSTARKCRWDESDEANNRITDTMNRMRILRHADTKLTAIIVRALEERFSAYDFDTDNGTVYVTTCPDDKMEMVRAFAAGALYASRATVQMMK